MHNPYIHDLFTEGFGNIFFMKYYNFVNKKIANKSIRKILIGIHTIIYLLFLILVGILLFITNYPL